MALQPHRTDTLPFRKGGYTSAQLLRRGANELGDHIYHIAEALRERGWGTRLNGDYETRWYPRVRLNVDQKAALGRFTARIQADSLGVTVTYPEAWIMERIGVTNDDDGRRQITHALYMDGWQRHGTGGKREWTLTVSDRETDGETGIPSDTESP